MTDKDMVVATLRQCGLDVSSVWNFVNTRESYEEAIPALIEMLAKVEDLGEVEGIARALTVKEAASVAAQPLIVKFRHLLSDRSQRAETVRWAIATCCLLETRWAIGNALETLSKGNADACMRLLRDPRGSGAYDMLILAAANTKGKRFIPLFLEYLGSEKLQGFAARGLGILKAEEAIPKLKELAGKTKNSWVRREALTALRRMGVDAAVPKAGEKKSAKPKSEGSGRGSGKARNQEKKPTEEPSSGPLAERLSVLTECGIRLSSAVTPDVVASRISPEGPEKDSYQLLLCTLGEEAEADSEVEDTDYLSDDIWHFDTECIEDHGSYAAIAERMVALAQGDQEIDIVL